MFEEIDALRDAVDKLTLEIESVRDYQNKLEAETAEDQNRWLGIAENQCRRLAAADKDAIELHEALVQADDGKVFWQKHCYLLTHFPTGSEV